MNINIKILSLLIILIIGISTVNGTENVSSNDTVPNITVVPTIPNETTTPNITVVPTIPNETTATVNITETPTSNNVSIPTVTPKTGSEYEPKSPPTEPIIIIMPGQPTATSTPTPGVSGYGDFYDKVILAAVLGLIGLSYEIIKIKYEHKKKSENEKAKVKQK